MAAMQRDAIAEVELCQQQLVSSAQHEAHEKEQKILLDGFEHSV